MNDALDVFNLKIEVLFATTGAGEIDPGIEKDLLDFLREEFNDGLEVSDAGATATFNFLNQTAVYRMLSDDHAVPPVDLTVEISDWGQIEAPYAAVYGHVSGLDVAEWVKDHGNNLMDKNVRFGLGGTAANEKVLDTATKEPELFWYFNNGLTLLCESINKAPKGGSDRRVGMFEFKGASLVNGAQTSTTLLRALKDVDAENSALRVMVRFISLESAKESFGRSVTRATNTQNAIGGQDFAALDPVQQRLQQELSIDSFHYILKRGETVEAIEEGCSFTEAAIALASIHSADFATQAKREAGKLWNDIEKPPYTELFNNNVSYIRLRRAVELTRKIQKSIDDALPNSTDREKQFMKHGNRLLAFCVSQHLCAGRKIETFEDAEWLEILAKTEEETLRIFTLLKEITDEEYGTNAYLAALFKNKTKTQEISAKLVASGAWRNGK